MELRFSQRQEDKPGTVWLEHFARVGLWYEQWYFREGDARRPTYMACESAMRKHMPELLPVWRELCQLAGGTDRVARMLSMLRPPAYMTGCSQVLWTRNEPVLLRNYDYRPTLCDGLLLCSRWTDTRVIASIDSLWGALDGMNEHGLALSLAFGGRNVVGEGFGVPILLRYALETCKTTNEAVAALCRVPSHMSYSISIIDRAGATATVFVRPDEPSRVVNDVVATNHQGAVEWLEYATASRSVERHEALSSVMRDPSATVESLLARLLEAPLRVRDPNHELTTLYTAVYRPMRGEVEFHWPQRVWRASFDDFEERSVHITL